MLTSSGAKKKKGRGRKGTSPSEHSWSEAGVRRVRLPALSVSVTATLHGPQGGGGASPRPAPLPPPSPRLPARCCLVPRAARSWLQAGTVGLPSPRKLTTTQIPTGSSGHQGQRKPGHLRSQVSTWEDECGADREPGIWDRVARPQKEEGRRLGKREGEKLGLGRDRKGGSVEE